MLMPVMRQHIVPNGISLNVGGEVMVEANCNIICVLHLKQSPADVFANELNTTNQGQ